MSYFRNILILLLGFGLLLNGLTALDLWVDEGWSVAATAGDTPISVTQMVAEDVHPPLYFYALYIWRSVTGHTIFAMRYYSVLMIIVCAAVIYRLGKKLQSDLTGALAAVLYILHDLVRVLGQEIRQYPQAQLLTALLVWAYLSWWEKPTHPRTIALILAGLALLWTVYWGGFVLLALGLHSLLTRRNIIKPYIIIAIGFLPWLPVLYFQLTQQIGAEGLGHALPPTWYGFQVLIYQLLGRPEWFWLVLSAIGMWHVAQRRIDPRRFTLGLVIVITAGLSLVINLLLPTLTYRMLSILIPLILLLAAAAIGQLTRFWRISASVGVIMLSIWLPSAGHPVHLPWRNVAEFIAQHRTATDTVLIDTWFDTYAFAFYLDQQNVSYIPTELHWRRNQRVDVQDLDGIWLVRYSSDAPTQTLLTNFTQTGAFNWQTALSPITLIRYDRPPSSDNLVTWFADDDTHLRLLDTQVHQTKSGISVNLWWSPSKDLDQNYSVSVFLLDDNGMLVGQHDSYPLNNYSPTAGWLADGLYFDSHYLSTDMLA
ncbi:MAG: hypothetical protein CUN56_13910, partial [Phototrophicales bacterium]